MQACKHLYAVDHKLGSEALTANINEVRKPGRKKARAKALEREDLDALLDSLPSEENSGSEDDDANNCEPGSDGHGGGGGGGRNSERGRGNGRGRGGRGAGNGSGSERGGRGGRAWRGGRGWHGGRV